jgi:hypothetical protein
MGLQIMAYTPKAQRGLYYNINQRRAAGLPPKRKGQAGYPTKEAFIRSARTAKR